MSERFRPGQELTAENMNSIADQLQTRIIGGKNINVRAFNNRLIIEKQKFKKRREKEVIPVKKHGIIYMWDESNTYGAYPGLWNSEIEDLKDYEYQDSRSFILSHDTTRDNWDWSQQDPDTYFSLPGCFVFNTSLSTPPKWGDAGLEYDPLHVPPCGVGGHWRDEESQCWYRKAVSVDPYDPVQGDDEYWLFSALGAFTAWQNAFITAIGNIPSPIETYTYWQIALHPDYFNFEVCFERWIRHVYNYTFPGDGLTEYGITPLPNYGPRFIAGAEAYCEWNKET